MLVRILAAVAVAAGGLLHLQIWSSDYQDLPSEVPGAWVVKQGFPANVAASALIALALLLTAFGVLTVVRTWSALAALAVEVGSIGALVLSRGPGFFGWTEKGYDGDAKKVLIVEVIAVLLAVATVAVDRRKA